MSNLAQRLQVKSGTNWIIINAPQNYAAILEAPDTVKLNAPLTDSFNGIHLFVKNSTDLALHLNEITPALKPDTIFWIMYPKKNSSIPTDLLMTRNWDNMAKIGWRPVQSAAVDDTWTALRFKPENLVKQSGINNEAIKTNQYAAYINPDKKQVTLPPELHAALSQHPAAMAVFEKLAYSHKKEYVLWVLTAKQEQTRINRIQKTVDMLLDGKKNPSQK